MNQAIKQNLSTLISSSIRKVDKSETLLLNELSRELEASGKQVFKLGFGESPFPPPQFVIEALTKNSSRKDYTKVQGLPELCSAIASFHSKFHSMDIKSDNVLVGPGSKILIFNILQCFKKANVIISVPAWVSYEPQAHLVGHNVIRLKTTYGNRWRVLPEDIEKTCGNLKEKNIPMILILNYPGNPDGLTYTATELKELSHVLKKYNVLVIADEIYGPLHHEGKHETLAKYYLEGTIITTGLSKWCGAGGWRLGVVILPDELTGDFKECLVGINSETFSCASTPVQLAAIEAYKNGEKIYKELAYHRKILSSLGNKCQKMLMEADIKVHKPQGGFYLYLDFSSYRDKLKSLNINSNQKLCQSLLKDTGVAILPGDAFGADISDLTARLAYVDFDGEVVLNKCMQQELNKDLGEEFLQANCGKVIAGVQNISDWIKAVPKFT